MCPDRVHFASFRESLRFLHLCHGYHLDLLGEEYRSSSESVSDEWSDLTPALLCLFEQVILGKLAERFPRLYAKIHAQECCGSDIGPIEHVEQMQCVLGSPLGDRQIAAPAPLRPIINVKC